ncbi:extracellular solute-binding protein [Halorussus salilacus]|nr:extracellular solute-binding protein [Halorussus salilacus]USZ69173.1 extracellular solute-binding protein [Halorussus salilacus]
MKDDTTERRGGVRTDSGVSRRRFIEAAGASGIAAGLTGYVGEGGVSGSVQSQGTTIQWASDQLAADNEDEIVQSLYDNGLSEDIEIDILAGAWGGGRQSQYQQWLSSGREKPDVFMMDTGWTIPFIVREQVVDLSQELPEDAISTIEDDYFQAHVDTARGPEGNLHGVPLFIDLPTMQYRRDLVEDAGYDPEGENWATESMTWQEFSEMVSDVRSQNEDDIDYGFTFQAQSYEGLACCTFNEFMTSWGGAYFGNPRENLFGPIGDRPVTVGEEQVVDSVRMIRSFIHGSDAEETLDDYQQISPAAVLQWDEEPSRQPFTSGNAVAHRNWPYAINESGAEDALGEDLGVMPIPYAATAEEAEYPGTGGPVAALGGWHMTVNPNSQNREEAMELLQVMMEPDFRLLLFEVIGWTPPQPELLETDRAAEVPVMGRYLDQLRVAGENAISRPVTAIWPQQSQRIAQQVNEAYSEGGNPEELMSQLQGQLEQLEQQQG